MQYAVCNKLQLLLFSFAKCAICKIKRAQTQEQGPPSASAEILSYKGIVIFVRDILPLQEITFLHQMSFLSWEFPSC